MKKQNLYAFWKYDLCPYVLGGIITEFKDDGYVRVKGYTGMCFKPIAILPDKAGKEALDNLKKLRAEYDSTEKSLKHEYKNKVRELLGLEPEVKK